MEGDDTAARAGHLTLNPIKQMGFFSLVMLAVIGICWGMVPVNPANFRRKASDLIVSLAGPLTNLALACVFIIVCVGLKIVYLLFESIEISGFLSGIELIFNAFLYGSVMNIVLFFFNILPIPGLDGWAIIRYFVSPEKMMNSEFIAGAGVVLFLLAMYFMDYIYEAAFAIVDFILMLF